MSQTKPDGVGVIRAVSDGGVGVTFQSEWPAHEVFERGLAGKADGGTAAAGLRTVSKGSSRGQGPLKKQGRVARRAQVADDVRLCAHGQRMMVCAQCALNHCSCPGSPRHACEGK